MSKELKCPMCKSTDIETYKDNPDDKGMCWHTYYECRKCGRTCRDYDWLKLTDYEIETIKTKMLTAEIERLKAEVTRYRRALHNLKEDCQKRLHWENNSLEKNFLHEVITHIDAELDYAPDTGKMEEN